MYRIVIDFPGGAPEDCCKALENIQSKRFHSVVGAVCTFDDFNITQRLTGEGVTLQGTAFTTVDDDGLPMWAFISVQDARLISIARVVKETNER